VQEHAAPSGAQPLLSAQPRNLSPDVSLGESKQPGRLHTPPTRRSQRPRQDVVLDSLESFAKGKLRTLFDLVDDHRELPSFVFPQGLFVGEVDHAAKMPFELRDVSRPCVAQKTDEPAADIRLFLTSHTRSGLLSLSGGSETVGHRSSRLINVGGISSFPGRSSSVKITLERTGRPVLIPGRMRVPVPTESVTDS